MSRTPRECTKASSGLCKSLRFGAALCEISGNFLIFPAVRQEPHSTVCVLHLAPWPQSSRQPIYSVTGHENRAVCGSPRSERRVSAFRRRGDRNHADREFAFADLLLRPLAQTAKPPGRTQPTALPYRLKQCRALLQGGTASSGGLSNRQ
jgi:hypothetical protein